MMELNELREVKKEKIWSYPMYFEPVTYVYDYWNTYLEKIFIFEKNMISHTGNWTRASRVKAEYPSH